MFLKTEKRKMFLFVPNAVTMPCVILAVVEQKAGSKIYCLLVNQQQTQNINKCIYKSQKGLPL